MSFEMKLAGERVSDGRLFMPARGLWSANVHLDTPKALAAGSSVVLTLGDLSLTGFVVEGGPYAQTARYLVAAGAGGWRKQVPARAYRVDAGAKLSVVLRDLAQAVGETWLSGYGPGFVERSLDYCLARARETAAAVLHRLIGRAWYIADDGKTVMGDRTTSSRATAEVLNADLSVGAVRLATDTPSKVRPGQTVQVGTSSRVLETVEANTGRGGVWLKGWVAR